VYLIRKAGVYATHWLPSADDGLDPYAYISDLVVRAAHRRRGIGRDLLVRAESFAREFGAKQLKVGVLVRNEATHTFYRTGGFRDHTVQLVKPLDADIVRPIGMAARRPVGESSSRDRMPRHESAVAMSSFWLARPPKLRALQKSTGDS
jgi:Acetyltransferase (GNAT) family